MKKRFSASAQRMLLAGLVTIVQTSPALADSVFPNRPIKMIVPFSAGGATDVVARNVAERIGQQFGQPVVVENKVGAGGNIAYEYVAKSHPDGYTILFGSTGLATNASLYQKLSYNAIKDFAPISLVARSPHALVVHPSVQANTVQELVALSKQKPLNYGSSGNGTILHLAGEMLKSNTGANLIHVPYKGGSAAMADLLSGVIQLGFLDLSISMPQIQAGKLKVLATTGETRAPTLPQIPTVAEAGVPGYAIDVWFAMFAPAGTSPAVVQKLNQSTMAVLKDPGLQQKMQAIGQTLQPSTSEQLGQFLRSETRRIGAIVKSAGATVE
ncbi:tripartite tricarboxylate transporter substrate binding protein [Comamonas sp. C11]|uniref:Bug family tripartite tricarboxylate transporter substrate binding protein n=1 Tax=Comamonas sp. C11 TaxID=2966554 RepID=UPI002111D2F2|nr:tripartite tricarboxylate transporter substrate binding protein [Comamonas sp. C11]UUC94156.1 tripartite tricarboxylate transporter substrate binding protein [Comamonas sp. C11]